MAKKEKSVRLTPVLPATVARKLQEKLKDGPVLIKLDDLLKSVSPEQLKAWGINPEALKEGLAITIVGDSKTAQQKTMPWPPPNEQNKAEYNKWRNEFEKWAESMRRQGFNPPRLRQPGKRGKKRAGV